jgi:predicted O-methyltransferase YrrM
MNTLDYILKKFSLSFDDKTPMPIEIPGVGRDELAVLLDELGFKTGVEVGVAAGEYSEILCEANPQMKLYGVDPYKPYRNYQDYVRPSTFAKLHKEARQRLGDRPNYEFIEEFSMDAIKRFADNSLDFVYIDANHREPFITQDITKWHKKIRPEGVISGHDYNSLKGTGTNWAVKAAVHRFAQGSSIKPWFILGPRAGDRATIEGSSCSWMWVKA